MAMEPNEFDVQDGGWELGENPLAGGASAPSARIPRVPGQSWVEDRTRVAVGRNITVSGRLAFQEPVRIEGGFRGEVSSIDLLVIAGEARVEGRVRAPRLLILGELRGEVSGASRVVLGPRARVFGRVEAKYLTVCEGACLNAEVRMQRDELEAELQSRSRSA